ncbi:hypothetical protein L1049_005406 [Liquidambar formosana]|uniref:Uncharacterized protein n=1 Tax=Liquidambar formosana TaxID=63359 RepID=A0AAP0X1F3_LIQFO
MSAPPYNLDDYSPSSTIIPFERPLPLLRGPVPAGSTDDPSIGPFVLAFRDAQAWRSAYRACESKLIEQCEGGARIGCSLSASSKCKPPWWRALIGRISSSDFAERAKCEEHETEICMSAAKENCVRFAKEKCLNPFRDARVAVRERKVDSREVSKLISLASASNGSAMANSIGVIQLGSWLSSKFVYEVTNCRGSDLLGPDK